jgi:GNAT superfamily N-acetyltransferase
MDYHIRPVRSNDAAAIAEIHRAVGWWEHLARETPDQTRQRVGRHIELCQVDGSHAIWVATDPAGHVVGYTSVHWVAYLTLPGPEGFVSEVFVHPEHQGRGIGSQLLELVRQEAIRLGCYRLSLNNVRKRESYQRGYYVKKGWVERSEVADFILLLPPAEKPKA